MCMMCVAKQNEHKLYVLHKFDYTEIYISMQVHVIV